MNLRQPGIMINSILGPLGVQVRRRQFPHYLRDLDFCTVLDIGANTGQFASIARSWSPRAVIHSFEPLPNACRRLRQQADRDGLIFVHPVALGDVEGDADMQQNEFSPSSSFLSATSIHKAAFPHTAHSQSLRVKITRLDSWAAFYDLPEPLLIKIDVQGYEDRVLRGGERTIRKATALVIEVSFQELYSGQLLFDDLYVFVKTLGFQCVGFDELVHDRDTGKALQADAVFLRRALSTDGRRAERG